MMFVVITDIKSVTCMSNYCLKSGTEKWMVPYHPYRTMNTPVSYFPTDYRVCEGVVSSYSGVWGGDQAKNGFQCFSSITECLLLICFKHR